MFLSKVFFCLSFQFLTKYFNIHKFIDVILINDTYFMTQFHSRNMHKLNVVAFDNFSLKWRRH